MEKKYVFHSDVDARSYEMTEREVNALLTCEGGCGFASKMLGEMKEGELATVSFGTRGTLECCSKFAGVIGKDEIVQLIAKTADRYLLMGESIEVTADDVVGRFLPTSGRGGSELHGFVVNVVGKCLEGAIETVHRGEF